LAKNLRKAVVLRKVGEHDILVPLIYNEDVAGWLHNIPTKGAERCDLTPIPKDLVTVGSTLAAGVAEDSRTLNGLIFDKLVISFHDFQLLEDAKLHRSAGLLPTKATMAPYSQYWLAGDLSLESTAHARPVSFSHLQIFFLQALQKIDRFLCLPRICKVFVGGRSRISSRGRREQKTEGLASWMGKGRRTSVPS
jgi:hypothetical protein